MSAYGNPYRGWVMVERPTGIYMTHDNLHYIRVSSIEQGKGFERLSNKIYAKFHSMVDEMEDK